MSAATLLARQRVEAHEFAELDKIGHAAGLLERLVERVRGAGHADVGPELFPQRGNLLQSLLQAFARARHAAEFPHDFAEAFVEMTDGLLALIVEEALGHRSHVFLGALELGAVRARPRARLL